MCFDKTSDNSLINLDSPRKKKLRKKFFECHFMTNITEKNSSNISHRELCTKLMTVFGFVLFLFSHSKAYRLADLNTV